MRANSPEPSSIDGPLGFGLALHIVAAVGFTLWFVARLIEVVT